MAKKPLSLEPDLEEMKELLDMVPGNDQARVLHRLRVMCRQIDTFLRLSRQRILRDDVSELRKRLAGVREIDVLRDMDMPDGWESILLKHQAAQRVLLNKLLVDPWVDALIEGLANLPDLERSHAAEARADLARAVLKAGAVIEGPDATLEDFHTLRIRIKRLRYAREYLKMGTGYLRRAQAALGAMNDADMQLHYLERLPPDVPVDDWVRERREVLDEEMDAMRAAWPELRRRVEKNL